MRAVPYILTRCVLLAWFVTIESVCPCRAYAASAGSMAHRCCQHAHRPGDHHNRPAPNCVHCGTAERGVLVDGHPFTGAPDLATPLPFLHVVGPILADVVGDPRVPAIHPSPPPLDVPLSTCARLL